MNDEFKDFDDDNEEVYDTITMTDENGKKTDFVIIDCVEVDNNRYLLVVEADDIDSEEQEADILKECAIDGEEVIYELVEDENELNKVYIMLQDNDSDYDMKFE